MTNDMRLLMLIQERFLTTRRATDIKIFVAHMQHGDISTGIRRKMLKRKRDMLLQGHGSNNMRTFRVFLTGVHLKLLRGDLLTR